MNAEKTSGQISLAEFLKICDRYLDPSSNTDIKCLSQFVVGTQEKGHKFRYGGTIDEPSVHVNRIKKAIQGKEEQEEQEEQEDGDFGNLNLEVNLDITPQDRLKCAIMIFDVINEQAHEKSKSMELYKNNSLARAFMTSAKLWGNPEGDLTKMIDKLNQENPVWIQAPENKKLFTELIEKSKMAEKMPELGLLQEKIKDLPPEVSKIYGPGKSNSSQEEQIKACREALLQLAKDHPEDLVSVMVYNILWKFGTSEKTTTDIVKLQIETAKWQHIYKGYFQKSIENLRVKIGNKPDIEIIKTSADKTSELIKDKEKNLTYFEWVHRQFGGHHQELSDLSKKLESHADQLHKIIIKHQQETNKTPKIRGSIFRPKGQ